MHKITIASFHSFIHSFLHSSCITEHPLCASPLLGHGNPKVRRTQCSPSQNLQFSEGGDSIDLTSKCKIAMVTSPTKGKYRVPQRTRQNPEGQGIPEEWKLNRRSGWESIPGKGNSVRKDLELGRSVARMSNGRKCSAARAGSLQGEGDETWFGRLAGAGTRRALWTVLRFLSFIAIRRFHEKLIGFCTEQGPEARCPHTQPPT